MKPLREIAMVGATIAIGAAPTLALAAAHPSHPTGPPSTVTTGSAPASHPGAPTGGGGSSHLGPGASLPAKAKAYGKYCSSESKKHVAGQPGTPFSKCVTDMAKLAHGATKNPRTACKDESKKHVAGQPGTPFSLCVSAGAKLLKDDSSSGSSTTTTTSTTSTDTTTTSTTSTTSSSSDTTATP